jgi:NRPS condensation-like uncharacterized protein
VIILKAHHCFTDGLGFATWFLSMSEGEFDTSALPGLKPLSFFKKLLIKLLYPILLLTQSLKILLTFADHNAIKKRMPMSGRKKGAFTTDLNLNRMKEYCKHSKCTINDYVTSLMSCSLYEYF